MADYIYYQYSIPSSTATCGNAAATAGVYTFRANGDLDGNAVESTFDLAVGSSTQNELYHARGFNIVNETE
jgi:hypothetical protein